MIILLSPSKSLNEKAKTVEPTATPLFIEKSRELMDSLKVLTPIQIEDLMQISPKLAELNFLRYQKWTQIFTKKNASSALFTFNGDVYDGLNAGDFTKKEIDFAQSTIRILSGLYGLLRPKDLMQAYRLEMSIKLKTTFAKDLYQFWGDLLTETINEQAIAEKKTHLINLASEEYFKAINVKALKLPVITPIFKQEAGGKYKIVSFYAKKARGMMTRFVIKNKISNPEEMKAFNDDGYHFNPEISTKTSWAFTR